MTPTTSAGIDFQTWTIILIIAIVLLAGVVVAGIMFGNAQARERHRVAEAAEERAADVGEELPAAPSPPPASGDGGGLPPPAPPPQTDPQAVPEPPAPVPDPLHETLGTPAPTPEPAVAMVAPPAPVPEAASVPVRPAAVEPAIAGSLSLTTIKGLGPKVAAMLAERGVTRVDQIAALSADEARALDAELGTFSGRMARDRWIDQAKLLSKGDTAAYEAEFGKLG